MNANTIKDQKEYLQERVKLLEKLQKDDPKNPINIVKNELKELQTVIDAISAPIYKKYKRRINLLIVIFAMFTIAATILAGVLSSMNDTDKGYVAWAIVISYSVVSSIIWIICIIIHYKRKREIQNIMGGELYNYSLKYDNTMQSLPHYS